MHVPVMSVAVVRLRSAAVAMICICMGAAACDNGLDADAAKLAHGSPASGKRLIQAYGCGTCHAIPGIPGAEATVGPPLGGIARRSYIAGVLTNEPDHMVQWLMDPPAVDSSTAMPKVGLTAQQAHDIAAYLYTLR